MSHTTRVMSLFTLLSLIFGGCLYQLTQQVLTQKVPCTLWRHSTERLGMSTAGRIFTAAVDRFKYIEWGPPPLLPLVSYQSVGVANHFQ